MPDEQVYKIIGKGSLKSMICDIAVFIVKMAAVLCNERVKQ